MNAYLKAQWESEMERERRFMAYLKQRRNGLYGRKRRALERRIKAAEIAVGLWQGRLATEGAA